MFAKSGLTDICISPAHYKLVCVHYEERLLVKPWSSAELFMTERVSLESLESRLYSVCGN